LPNSKDPFDRLIIWQSISRKLTPISQDRAFADYKKLGLKVIWLRFHRSQLTPLYHRYARLRSHNLSLFVRNAKMRIAGFFVAWDNEFR